MEIHKSASLFIYRIREKGLEIFLERNGDSWQIPQQVIDANDAIPEEDKEKIIELDPVTHEDGQVGQGIAVEGDWHDIPSLKSLFKQDVKFMANQLKLMIPEAMEKGTYVAIKEAFKRVAPHQYEMLKELKDIITDRNSVKDM